MQPTTSIERLEYSCDLLRNIDTDGHLQELPIEHKRGIVYAALFGVKDVWFGNKISDKDEATLCLNLATLAEPWVSEDTHDLFVQLCLGMLHYAKQNVNTDDVHVFVQLLEIMSLLKDNNIYSGAFHDMVINRALELEHKSREITYFLEERDRS